MQAVIATPINNKSYTYKDARYRNFLDGVGAVAFAVAVILVVVVFTSGL